MWIDGHVHLTEPLDILLNQMKISGIGKAIVCSSSVARGEEIRDLSSAQEVMARVENAQRNPGSLRSPFDINRELAEVTQNHGSRLIGFGKVDLYRDDVEAQLADISILGLAGVGEVVGIHRNMERLLPVLAYSHEQDGFPVFIHCDYPVDEQDLAELFDVIRLFKKSKVIIGHLGGNHWLQTVSGAVDCPSCGLDLSEAVNTVAVQVAAKTLPERVFFGSDFPWETPEVNLVRLKSLNLSDRMTESVMGENLREFLGMDGL